LVVLQEVGTVLRRARSGMVIIKLTREPKEGQVLYDENERPVGRVTEIFGPVRSPFASLAPYADRAGGLVGRKVYSRS
jgi:rRNA processing protein Gar1